MSLSLALVAVLLGGVCQGSSLLPMKFTRRWQWENTWICFSTVAYLLLPWLLALLLVSDYPAMLRDVPPRVLGTTLLFGVGWGLGALAFGLGFRYLGLAITYAIVLGLASSVGTLIPLLVLTPEQVITRQGITLIVGVVIALVGTAVVSWAAWERDARKTIPKATVIGEGAAKKLVIGLLLCGSSGLLVSSGNLGLAFGSQISQKALELGAGPTGAGCAIWAVLLFPMFLCNSIYSLYLLRKNRSARHFRDPGTGHYWGLAVLMGVLWMGGLASYGAGALALGKLGTSIGWALFMSSTIIVANSLGIVTGEWKGASRKAITIMATGIAILLLAIVVVGTSRTSA
jgi:L-rhamnose-H+ transport protein